MTVGKTSVGPVGIYHDDLKKEQLMRDKKKESPCFGEETYLVVGQTWGGGQECQFLRSIRARS